MPKAYIRGIYSTALTKLLLEGGFEMVRPSSEIRERFKLIDKAGEEDISIHDRDDKQGVRALGYLSALDQFVSLVKEKVPEAVFRWIVKAKASTSSEGTGIVEIEFPKPAKARLDQIRSMVTHTIKGHHYYKAWGGSVASFVEMTERLLASGRPYEEALNLFKKSVETELPTAQSTAFVDHVKLDGRVFHLGKAIIDEFLPDERISFHRVFERHGVYDGIGEAKEPGDMAITEAALDEWYFKTRYFSKDGLYKGTYINIATPLEVYPDRIRYVDLEVDVVIKSNGDAFVLDDDKLELAWAEGIITEKMFERARETVRLLIKA